MNAKPVSVTPEEPCRICGKGDWCFRFGNAHACRREQGAGAIQRVDKQGQVYYLHVSDGPVDLEGAEPPDEQWREERAAPSVLHDVYTALLRALGLSPTHFKALRDRGLDGEAIERNAYASLPDVGEARSRAVLKVQNALGRVHLANVPGFYRKGTRADTLLAGKPGLLVPVRNADGQIIALKIRLDDPPTDDNGKVRSKYVSLSAPKGEDIIGCGPGAQLHVPLLHDVPRGVEVWITEGELKADIATALAERPVVGAPGVGGWPLTIPVLRAWDSSKVVLVFDSDARRKPSVATALQGAAAGIAQTFGPEAVGVAVWPEDAGKGIDDVLAAGRGADVTVHWGPDAWRAVAELVAASGAQPDPTIEARKVVAESADRIRDDHRLAYADAFLAAVAQLQAADAVGEFEAVRDMLKRLGIRVKPWDEAVRKKQREIERVLRRTRAAGDWRRMFLKLEGQDGEKVAETVSNIVAALVHCPAWEGVLGVDEFAHKVVKFKKPPWPQDCVDRSPEQGVGTWTDEDDDRLRIWVEHEFDFTPAKEWVRSAVLTAARSTNSFHPVRDYLAQAHERWDGRPRLKTWLREYLKSDQDPEYLARVGTWFMVGAVKRVFDAGCKQDYCLVLEGEQGVKKTTAIETLAVKMDWYAALHSDLQNKDALQILCGKWWVELAELSSVTRGEFEKVKAYISERQDTYRKPYGARPEDVPRQNVFAGTINPAGEGYIRDDTGGRRFWPIECGNIDLEALARDRDQLWGEAVQLYRDNVRTYPLAEDEELLREEQEQRQLPDPWEVVVAEWISSESPNFLTTADIAKGALNIEVDRISRAEESRIGRVMKRLGWVVQRPRKDNPKRTRGYVPAPPKKERKRWTI